MKTLLTVVFLLIASTSWAGPEMMLAFVGKRLPVTTNAIGGVSSISATGTTNTGTGYGSGTGTISIAANCDTLSGGAAAVYLVVNGVATDSLVCPVNSDLSATLTETVSGAYSVRVYGTATGGADFGADSFSFPTQ